MSLYRQPGRARALVLAAVAAVALLVGGAIGFAIGRSQRARAVRGQEVVDRAARRAAPGRSGLQLLPTEYPQAARGAGDEYAAVQGAMTRIRSRSPTRTPRPTSRPLNPRRRRCGPGTPGAPALARGGEPACVAARGARVRAGSTSVTRRGERRAVRVASSGPVHAWTAAPLLAAISARAARRAERRYAGSGRARSRARPRRPARRPRRAPRPATAAATAGATSRLKTDGMT